MTNQDSRPRDAANLRQEAEAFARERDAGTPQDSAALSPEEVRKTLHELRVHQIELEMQNEELRTSQAEIAAGRARYFDLYDFAPVGYCTLSEQGLILEANLTAASLLGAARGTLMKQPISRFVLRDDQDIYYLHRKKLLETGETQECELRLVRPDGEHFWAHLTGVAAQAEDGKSVYRVVISDITKRKKAEEDRLALERQLLQSQKLESLGVLAGGIAHDFNNLLQVILGNVDLAAVRLAPGASERLDLEEAMRAANRAADLTRQMLAYAGKGRYVIEEVNLSDLAAENASMFRTAISRIADLQVHGEPELPPILADAAQMQQVLMNLLTNASEAVGEGPGNVTLRTGAMDCDEAYLSRSCLEEKAEPGRFVWLEVADDGCGMDEETQKRLFEPFYTTKFAGRGLGLSAVMGIVRGHRGALLLGSDLGRGTTIRVLFPALQREGASAAEVKAADPGVAVSIVSSLGTILVVDDQPAVRAFCARALRSQGFDVLTAQDGEEALGLFREHKEMISCTLLEFTMPGMSGLATFQEIRRIKPDAKVVLCSGYGEEKATESFKGEGLAGFLQKPYTLDAMRAVLGEALKNKASV